MFLSSSSSFGSLVLACTVVNSAENDEDGSVRSVCALGRGRFASCWDLGRSHIITIHKVTDGSTTTLRTAHTESLSCLCMVSPDVLASGSMDRTVRLHDMRTGDTPRILWHNKPVRCMCVVTADTLVTATGYDTLTMWDLRTNTRLHVVTIDDTMQTGMVLCLCAVSTEHFAVGISSGHVQIWDAREGRCVRALTSVSANVTCMCMVSPHMLAGGTADGCITLWDVRTGHRVRVLTDESAAAPCCLRQICMLSASVLISASTGLEQLQGHIKLWNVHTGAVLCTLSDRADNVRAMCAVSPGVFVSGSTYDTLRVWNVHDTCCSWRRGRQTLDGDCFTSYVILPGVHRTSFNRAALNSVRRHQDSLRNVPVRAWNVIATFMA